jgi:hypothetical protein
MKQKDEVDKYKPNDMRMAQCGWSCKFSSKILINGMGF